MDEEEYRGRDRDRDRGRDRDRDRDRDRYRTNSLASTVELFSVHPCKVSKVEKYGAFLEFADGLRDERGRPQSGLLHVSQMAETRVEDPEKVVEVGEKIWAKVIRIDVNYNNRNHHRCHYRISLFRTKVKSA